MYKKNIYILFTLFIGFAFSENWPNIHVFEQTNFIDIELNTTQWFKFSDKLTLVDFWAPWCPPCRREIPSLQKTYDAFSHKGFQIVSMAFDDRTDLINFLKDRDPVVCDDDIKFMNWYHGSGEDEFNRPFIEEFNFRTIPHMVLILNGQVLTTLTESNRGRLYEFVESWIDLRSDGKNPDVIFDELKTKIEKDD